MVTKSRRRRKKEQAWKQEQDWDDQVGIIQNQLDETAITT